jgi:putative endonuclease
MKSGTKLTRSQSEAAGRRAERAAEIALQFKGYVILERRAKNHYGEIDLIVRRGNVLAFVEVKMRRKPIDPALVLTPRQMERITKAATVWASARRWSQNYQWRYDLVLVVPWRWPRHIKDAWRPTQDPTLESGRKGGNVGHMRHL